MAAQLTRFTRYAPKFSGHCLIILALGAVVLPGATCDQPPDDNYNNNNSNTNYDFPVGTTDVLTGPRLTLAGAGAASLSTYPRDDSLEGEVDASMILYGDQVRLHTIAGLAVNSAGQLIVVSSLEGFDSVASMPTGTIDISIFQDPTHLNGNHAPVRTVTVIDNDSTHLAYAIAYDATRDVLYIGAGLNEPGSSPPAILVFQGTESDSFNGERPADRTITCSQLGIPTGMFVTPSDDLYIVSQQFLTSVDVFADASTLDGEVFQFDRSISNFVYPKSIFVDAADNLWLLTGSNQGNDIHYLTTYPGASTLDGQIDDSVEVNAEIVGSRSARNVILDSSGTAYISDSDGKIFTFKNAASLTTGEQTPTHTAAILSYLADDGTLDRVWLVAID